MEFGGPLARDIILTQRRNVRFIQITRFHTDNAFEHLRTGVGQTINKQHVTLFRRKR